MIKRVHHGTVESSKAESQIGVEKLKVTIYAKNKVTIAFPLI